MERTVEQIEAAFCTATIGPLKADRELICRFARDLGLTVAPAANYLLALYHLAAAVTFVREIEAGRESPVPEIKRRLEVIMK